MSDNTENKDIEHSFTVKMKREYTTTTALMQLLSERYGLKITKRLFYDVVNVIKRKEHEAKASVWYRVEQAFLDEEKGWYGLDFLKEIMEIKIKQHSQAAEKWFDIETKGYKILPSYTKNKQGDLAKGSQQVLDSFYGFFEGRDEK